MNAIEFLKNKGVLKEGNTQWIVNYGNGITFDIVKLFEEYKNQDNINELMPLSFKAWEAINWESIMTEARDERKSADEWNMFLQAKYQEYLKNFK